MKRWMILPAFLLLLAALCACGQAPAEEEGPDLPGQSQESGDTDQTPAPQPEPEPAPQPEPEPEPEEIQAAFNPLVPASQAVDPAWFQDAAFLGDSVSVMLDMYNSSSGHLGTPAFFCSVSLSQSNALTYPAGHERLPEYPKGSGQRPRLLDGIAASGANKIYVMLGMNCIAGGVDRACQDLVTLVDEVLGVRPGAAILIQSVTPMTAASPRADGELNNQTIGAYNAKVQAVCQERSWYYVDVAQALSDENGYLRDDCSGDKAMGIHLNYNGAEVWADYLLTHVPEALK